MSFWNVFFLLLIFLPLLMFWAFALADILMRHDMGGVSKAIWLSVVVLVPVLGTLVYLVVRGPQVASQPVATVQPGGDVSGRFAASSRAEQLSLLAELHDRGKLTDAEFSAEKEQVFRRAPAAA